MKNNLFVLVILLCFQVFSQDFILDNFVSELSTRQYRVEEFRYIKKIARKLGIKHVYMFGGTAAAWGHYVRWDMRRELGIESLQSERFDYDYTNIFRANQDFDLVVDGTVEQAEALEEAIQKKFNYFSGTRATWEVRLLNEQRLDKDPIMGADFQNQHTDSHSTGLIEMMDCEGFDCVKDVRDIKNPQPAFLMDVFEAKLHYYFSKKHKKTKRFKAGMNPEILSVIRYFTKAVQYELQQRLEDIKVVQGIIDNFNPLEKLSWDRYVTRWLEKNAKKLIVNAIDMEFAQNLIELNGLKKKLIALGDPTKENTMAWWLNKEALKSYPIGQGDGKTAAELFEANKSGNIVVAHSTNSFGAFESITKSHKGIANVLVSRGDAEGELAVHGDGHYTKIGVKGVGGTGLTVRYILNPNAKEGSDFTVHTGDYILVKNKKALKLIYEEINLGAFEYFEKLANGFEFDFSDKGVLEKLKRRVVRQISKMSFEEIGEIEERLFPLGKNKKEFVNQWNTLVVEELVLKKLGIQPVQAYSDVMKNKIQNLRDSFIKSRKTKLRLGLLGAKGLTLASIKMTYDFLTSSMQIASQTEGILYGVLPVLGTIGGIVAVNSLVRLLSVDTLKYSAQAKHIVSNEVLDKMFADDVLIRPKNNLEFNGKSAGRSFFKTFSIKGIETFKLRVHTTTMRMNLSFVPVTNKLFPMEKYREEAQKIKDELYDRLSCEKYYK